MFVEVIWNVIGVPVLKHCIGYLGYKNTANTLHVKYTVFRI